jgi:hypothetical protein
VADCRDYDLELDRDRQEDINQMIDEVGTWSAEKKQAMKDRMKNLTYVAFTHVADDIMDELVLEQDANKNKVAKMIDGVESWSVEQKQAMKDRMENARDEKIGQVINDVMAEVRSTQGDDKN